MTKIQQMLAAGIPVIESQSDEAKGSYAFSALTQEQQALLPDIFNPPTPVQIAQRARKAGAKSEAGLATALKTITPAQAEAYIQTNVTDLASAKAVLKIMARMVIAMRDEVWSDLPEA